MTSFLCEFLAQFKMLTCSDKLATMLKPICQEKEKLLSLATTCPHAWQKHVLPANQNSKFWTIKLQSLPAHLGTFWRHSNIGREAKSISKACGHFVFGVLIIRTLLNSSQKNTDSHFAIRQVRTEGFLSWHFLILQRWLVFSTAKAVSLILADVSSSSLLLAFASSRLHSSSCFFLDEPFTWAKYLTPACRRRNVTVFGTWYSFAFTIVWAPRGDLFSNLIQGFACDCCVDVVWCFTAIHC